MPIKPTVKIDPDDIIRYLLYQQFYYGEDLIYGRTKDRSEHVNDSGKAIESFYSLINKNSHFIEEGRPRKYLEYFNSNIHEIPIDAILLKYQEYKQTMEGDMERHMALTIVVGDCLTEIHLKCFEASIDQLIDYIMEKQAIIPEYRPELTEKIKLLYGQSNPNIGMVYGLSFMKFIGQKMEFKYIVQRCQELLKKYYSSISEEIVD